MPEYGRAVQSMAEHLLTIEDRDKRRSQAAAVVEIMGLLQPSGKGTEDFKRVLWDHLWKMTDYGLDVEGPYPAPARDEAAGKPEPLSYPQTKLPHRHFGRKFGVLLQRALDEQDGEQRQALTQALGYFMKLAYSAWHRETVHDDAIRAELHTLSGGVLNYEGSTFRVPAGTAAKDQGQTRFGRGGRGGGFKGGTRTGGGAQPASSNGGGRGRKFYRNRNK